MFSPVRLDCQARNGQTTTREETQDINSLSISKYGQAICKGYLPALSIPFHKTRHREGLGLQYGKAPVARRRVRLLQVLLHVTAVSVAHVPLQVAPRTGRTLVKGGAAVHAVGHALRVGLGEIGGAAVAVVDAADTQEASC